MKTGFEKKDVSASGLRFAIVVSRWNSDITSSLARGAVRALSQLDAAATETFEVPGAFELPIVCLKAAESGRFDAVIALGAVIRGDTPHFDIVANSAAFGVVDAALRSGVPVAFGVLTVNDLEQARERAGDDDSNKGFEAAVSAVETVLAIKNIGRASLSQHSK